MFLSNMARVTKLKSCVIAFKSTIQSLLINITAGVPEFRTYALYAASSYIICDDSKGLVLQGALPVNVEMYVGLYPRAKRVYRIDAVLWV